MTYVVFIVTKGSVNTMRQVFSLNLISYLRCNGIKEVGVGFNDKTNKVYFIFDETEEFIRLVNVYKLKDTVVPLHGFIAEFKQLKQDMYGHMNEFKK